MGGRRAAPSCCARRAAAARGASLGNSARSAPLARLHGGVQARGDRVVVRAADAQVLAPRARLHLAPHLVAVEHGQVDLRGEQRRAGAVHVGKRCTARGAALTAPDVRHTTARVCNHNRRPGPPAERTHLHHVAPRHRRHHPQRQVQPRARRQRGLVAGRVNDRAHACGAGARLGAGAGAGGRWGSEGRWVEGRAGEGWVSERRGAMQQPATHAAAAERRA